MERKNTRQQREASRAYGTSTQPQYRKPTNLVILILYTLQASFVSASVNCALFEVQFPFDSVTPTQSNRYVLQVLPPQAYTIVSIAAPIGVQTSRINPSQYSVQLKSYNLTASIMVQQCEITGSYQLRMVQSENHLKVVSLINGVYFDYVKARSTSQTLVTKVPRITEVRPQILEQGKIATLRIAEDSFDYRKPIKCLFITPNQISESQALIQSSSFSEISCTVPTDPHYQDCYIAILNSQVLSQIHRVQLATPPILTNVSPLYLHVNEENQIFVLTVELSIEEVKNIWVRFLGQQRLYTGVLLEKLGYAHSFLIRVNLDYIVPNMSKQTSSGALEISVNGQDFTLSSYKITFLPQFSIDYITQTDFQLDVGVQIELFVSKIHPNCAYTCQIKTQDRFFQAPAIIIPNNFQTSDTRGRNHKFKTLCNIQSVSSTSQFKIGIESNGVTDWYARSLIFEDIRTELEADSISATVSVSIDGDYFKSSTFVVEQNRMNQTLYLKGRYTNQYKTSCVFTSANVKSQTTMRAVNETLALCQIPALPFGDYILIVGNSEFKFIVIKKPSLIQRQQIVTEGPITFSLDISLPKFDQSNVTCTFTSGVAIGKLVSSNFSSMFDAIECNLPHQHSQAVFTIIEVQLTSYLHIIANIATAYLPFSEGIWHPDQNDYLLPKDTIDFTDLLPALSSSEGLNCLFQFTLSDQTTVMNYSVPLKSLKCIFDPHLDFDAIVKTCSPVTLTLAGLTFVNEFKYCGESFLFIEDVYPSLLLQNQFRIKLNRDVQADKCRLNGVQVGQMHGQICTLNTTESLPTDKPISFEVSYTGQWFLQSPNSNKVIKPSNLPSFKSQELLYNPYSANTLKMKGFNLVKNAVYYISFDEKNASVIRVPEFGELNQVIIADVPPYPSLNLRLVAQDGQVVPLGIISLTYLPRIVSKNQVLEILDSRITPVEIDLDQTVLVQQALLIPQSEYAIVPQLSTSFTVSQKGQHTIVLVEIGTTTRDLAFSIELKVMYHTFVVDLPTNTTVTLVTKVVISSVWLLQTGLRIISPNSQVIRYCKLTYPEYTTSVAFDQGVCKTFDLNQLVSVSVGNSDETNLCHAWINLSYEPLVFNYQTSITVNDQIEDLILVHQDGYSISYQKNGSKYSYQTEWAPGQVEITMAHNQCILHGQTSYTQFILEPIQIQNITSQEEIIRVQFSSPITSELLSQLNLNLGWQDYQQQIDTYHAQLVKTVTVLGNFIEIKSERGLPDFVELSYNKKTVSIYVTSKKSIVQQNYLAQMCTLVREKIQINETIEATPNIRYDFNMTCTTPIEMNATEITYQTVQQSLRAIETQVREVINEPEPDVINRPYENVIVNISQSLAFRPAFLPPIILRKYNSTQVLIHFHTNETKISPKASDSPVVFQPIQISHDRLHLYKTSAPQLLAMQISLSESSVSLACSPLEPTRYYMIDKHTLVIYFKHVTMKEDAITCSIQNSQFIIDVLSPPILSEARINVNQAEEVSISVPAQVVCNAEGVQIRSVNGICKINTAFFTSPTQIDLILPLTTESSLLLGSYFIVQQRRIDDIQSVYNYVSFDSSDFIKSEQLAIFYKVNACNLTMTICDTMCFDKQLSHFNPLSGIFTFGTTQVSKDPITDNRVTMKIKISIATGNLTTHTIVIKYLKQNIIEMQSPSFMLDGFLMGGAEKLQLKTSDGIKIGANQAILSYLPTDEDYQFTLINLATPRVSLTQPTITQFDSNSIVVIQVICDESSVMPYAKLFYKLTEQLLFQQDAGLWYIYLGLSDFQLKSFAYGDVTLHLGSHIIQVAPYTQVLSQHQPEVQSLNLPPLTNVLISHFGPQLLVRDQEDTQMVWITANTTQFQARDYICRFQILEGGEYRYSQAYGDCQNCLKSQKMACPVPNLRKLQNNVTVDILLNNQEINNSSVVIPVTDPLQLTVTLLSHTEILVSTSSSNEINCMTNGTYQAESIKGAQVITVPFLRYGMIIQCGFTLNQLQALSSATISDLLVQQQRSDYFKQLMLTVKSVEPQIVQLPYQAIFVTLQFGGQLQLQREDLFQIYLEDPISGQLYPCQLLSGNRFEMPVVVSNETEYLQILNASRKPLQARIYLQKPIQLFDAQLILTKAETYLYQSSSSESLIPAQDLKVVASLPGVTTLTSIQCTYLLGGLLCRFKDKFVPSQQYSITTVFGDQKISSATVQLQSDFQETIPITVWPLEQIAPELFFQVFSRSQLLIPSTCVLINGQTTLISSILDSACSFQATSGDANLMVYDQSGFQIFESPVEVLKMPQISTITPDYFLADREQTVMVITNAYFESEKFNFIGLPVSGVNETQFKVTIPANFFTFSTDQLQVEQVKLTHLATGKTIVLPETLIAYQTPIKNPTIRQQIIDTSQSQTLELIADFIAPLPDYHIFCFRKELAIASISNNTIFFELEIGLPSGTLQIELYQNKTYIATFTLVAFQKYQKPKGAVVQVAESDLFSYEFVINLPDDFKIQPNVECEVNGMHGTARVLDQKLFCYSISKQRGGTVLLRFYVRQLEYRVLIAEDSFTFQIVPLMTDVQIFTQVLIRNTPGVIKMSLRDGYMTDQTCCVLNGHIQSPMLFEDSLYMCHFTANQLAEISSTVELRVSNFVPQVLNSLLIGNLDVPKSPFFAAENYVVYSPSVIFQGHKQQITVSVDNLDFEYFNYQSLNLSCQLQHDQQQVLKSQTSVSCMFTDESLCTIQIKLPAYKLKQGNYYLTLQIEQQYTFILKQNSLRVELPPQITGLFPTLIHTSKGSEATQLLVQGRNFLSFSLMVRCVLIFDTGSEIVLDADVISDSIIKCKVRPLQVYSQAFIQLQYQSQRITPNFNKKDGLPKVQFTSPLQIKEASPRTISIGADKAILLKVSHTLKPKGLVVSLTCVYSLDFGQIIQQSAAMSITVNDGAATIECESIQSLAVTAPTFLNLGLIIQYNQNANRYQFESLNKIVITALPIPVIVSTEPAIVYNLVTFRQLTVRGGKFYNSNSLKCLFGKQKTDAVFVSEGNIQCIISQLKFTEDQTQLQLQVTNDGGATKSDVFLVTMATQLPRVLQIQAPQVLFTGSRSDVILSGTSLHEIQLKVTQGPHTQFVYCNATNFDSKIQCIDLMFLKSGQYKVSVKNPLSQQYLKSNVDFWVYDKMLFNGITQQGNAYVGLDLNTTQILEIQQRAPFIKMECLVFGDDAILKYRTDIKVSFIDGVFLSTCALDCGTNRFLEFTVWLDRTIKLVQTTHVESKSRYMCQPILHQSQQVKTYAPITIPDAGVKPAVIELLPPLKFDLPAIPSVSAEPRRLVLSKPVYDSVCAVFPTACVIQMIPYLEFCSILGGLVTQNSRFFIVERQESRLVSIWGHNLDVSNPVCVFGGTQEVPATVVNQFNIQCSTPQYQAIESFTAVTVDIVIRVGIQRFNFTHGCNMTLIQLPQIKKINDGAPLFMDEYQDLNGKTLDLVIDYPYLWFESGYELKLMIYCDWFALTESAIVKDQATIPSIFGHTVWWNYSPAVSKKCQLFLQENTRVTPFAGVQAKLEIVFLLDFNYFAYTSVDNLVQFVDQLDKVLIVKIAGKSLDQVVNYFGSVSVALVAGDQTITSDSFTTTIESGIYRALFKSRQFRAGNYCLEIRFGTDVKSNTCSQTVIFKNQPTIWEIVDSVVSIHSLQSVVKGVYLDGLNLAGIRCLYQRYNGTGVYQISSAASFFDGSSSQFTCTLPDVYYDYFSSDKIFTLGLTTNALNGLQVT